MTGKEKYNKWLKAVKIDHNALLDVPKELWTNELCLEAVKTDYSALNYLSKKYLTKEICFEAYKQSPSSIRYVHKDLQQLYAKNIFEYNFSTLKNIFNSTKYQIYNLFNEFFNYISQVKFIIKDYNIEYNYNFNIFSSISETYYKENMHSDIIKLILDPKTEKIGSPKNMNLFVKLLNKIKPELKIVIGKNAIIEREKGRIDILISDSKNAIIIENKINFAKVQEDQLGRYYINTSKRGLIVKAIVYLTLSPEKDLKINYSIKDPILRETIKELIIPLPVLNKKNEISFSDDFIGKCINNSNNCISKIYYSEYRELLKSLGGSIMTVDLDRATLMEIYANKEKLESFNMFGALWDRREEVFNGIFRELLKENDFSEHPDDIKNSLYFRINDNISLGYHVKDWSFGFTYTQSGKKLSKKFQDDLKILLENKKLKDIFWKEPTSSHELWVWKTVDIDKIGEPKNLIYNFNILKEIINQWFKCRKNGI
jgi:hypothetical protein